MKMTIQFSKDEFAAISNFFGSLGAGDTFRNLIKDEVYGPIVSRNTINMLTQEFTGTTTIHEGFVVDVIHTLSNYGQQVKSAAMALAGIFGTASAIFDSVRKDLGNVCKKYQGTYGWRKVA